MIKNKISKKQIEVTSDSAKQTSKVIVAFLRTKESSLTSSSISKKNYILEQLKNNEVFIEAIVKSINEVIKEGNNKATTFINMPEIYSLIEMDSCSNYRSFDKEDLNRDKLIVNFANEYPGILVNQLQSSLMNNIIPNALKLVNSLHNIRFHEAPNLHIAGTNCKHELTPTQIKHTSQFITAILRTENNALEVVQELKDEFLGKIPDNKKCVKQVLHACYDAIYNQIDKSSKEQAHSLEKISIILRDLIGTCPHASLQSLIDYDAQEELIEGIVGLDKQGKNKQQYKKLIEEFAKINPNELVTYLSNQIENNKFLDISAVEYTSSKFLVHETPELHLAGKNCCDGNE